MAQQDEQKVANNGDFRKEVEAALAKEELDMQFSEKNASRFEKIGYTLSPLVLSLYVGANYAFKDIPPWLENILALFLVVALVWVLVVAFKQTFIEKTNRLSFILTAFVKVALNAKEHNRFVIREKDLEADHPRGTFGTSAMGNFFTFFGLFMGFGIFGDEELLMKVLMSAFGLMFFFIGWIMRSKVRVFKNPEKIFSYIRHHRKFDCAFFGALCFFVVCIVYVFLLDVVGI